MLEIPVKRLDRELPIPSYAHEGDAGCDLYSAIDLDLDPGERALVPTGIAVEIPSGYAGFIQPRSGLALRHGITLVNTPGLIDSHYRGEIKIIVLNTDRTERFRLKKGDRICQLVIQKVEQARVLETDELGETARGAAGFGSTGRR